MKFTLLIVALLTLFTGYSQSDREFAVINVRGEIIHHINAEEVFPVYNDRIRIKRSLIIDGVAVPIYGYLDHKGQEVIPIDYEDAKDFLGKTTWVKERGQKKYYQIDEYGSRLNDLEFEKIGDYSNGAWSVMVKNTYSDDSEYLKGFVTDHGELIIAPKYAHTYSYFTNGMNGLICVGLENQGHGYMDLEGRIVIEFEQKQKEFTNFQGGLVQRIEHSGKTGIMSSNQVWLAEPTSLKIKGFDHTDSIITIIYNEKTKSDFGFTNFRYKPLFTQRFEEASTFKSGHAEVKSLGKWGIVNKRGALVVPLKFDGVFNVASVNYFVAYNLEAGLITEWYYFDINGNPITQLEALSNRPLSHEVFFMSDSKNEVYLYDADGEKIQDTPYKKVFRIIGDGGHQILSHDISRKEIIGGGGSEAVFHDIITSRIIGGAGSQTVTHDFSDKGVSVVELLKGREYPSIRR